MLNTKAEPQEAEQSLKTLQYEAALFYIFLHSRCVPYPDDDNTSITFSSFNVLKVFTLIK